jgi:bile acid:Na+ symporter, BASS family
MTVQALIVLALKLSILLSVFAIGLDARADDAIALMRRPSQLLRSLLAIDVLMPLVVAGIVGFFDLRPPVEMALVALAVSPVPPILPKKQMKAGGAPLYAIGLLVLAALVAIVFIPLGVKLFGLFLQTPVAMKAWPIARLALVTILAPLAAGMALRQLNPAIALRIAQPIARTAGALLLICVVPVLITQTPEILAVIGNGTIAAIVAFLLVGLAAGHLLGGPDPHDRAVLALATATRHPGIALAIVASNFPEQKQILPVILLRSVLGAIVSIPYLIWRRKVDAAEAP